MKGKLTLNRERMEDTCSPGKNKQLYSFRIYTILIPIVTGLAFLEGMYIMSNIPGTLGSGASIEKLMPLKKGESFVTSKMFK
jgi:hypothetical protein